MKERSQERRRRSVGGHVAPTERGNLPARAEPKPGPQRAGRANVATPAKFPSDPNLVLHIGGGITPPTLASPVVYANPAAMVLFYYTNWCTATNWYEVHWYDYTNGPLVLGPAHPRQLPYLWNLLLYTEGKRLSGFLELSHPYQPGRW